MFDLCTGGATLVVMLMIAAVALQGAAAWVRVPPIEFGQAIAMTVLTTLILAPAGLAARVVIADLFRGRPPDGTEVGVAVGAGAVGVVASGWVYSKFFDGVGVRSGVVMALLAGLFETIMLFALVGALLAVGAAVR